MKGNRNSVYSCICHNYFSSAYLLTAVYESKLLNCNILFKLVDGAKHQNSEGKKSACRLVI